MVILAVDDEKIALEGLVKEIKKAVPDATVHGFRSASAAMNFLKEHSCDVVFLDIEMRGMNGVEFARYLKLQNPKLNIIFATGYDEYTKEAFSLHVSGYIMKPITAEKVKMEMEELRHPIIMKKHTGIEPLLKIQTFGNFEVYANGNLVNFSRSKSKELFAYLIHKCGSSCSTQELTALIFENRPSTVSLQRQFQTILSNMMKTLKSVGAEDCIVRRRNQTAVNPALLDCDYYHFMEGDPEAVKSYTGEYMANYSWAEFVVGYLDKKYD